ncbi:MAG: HAD family hydrolase, partial [Verrucomicrobia bacterium]|nr:HAD family hydrolase [Verrucomicrobiota bacterium]
DLDGTLTDPKAGITGFIQHALEKLDQPVPDKDELTWCIGPPLYDSFLELLENDADAAEKAMGFYRDRFETVGMFENELYAGIPDCLRQLKEAGISLFVATSKPHFYAKKIAEHFGISHFFNHIHGSEMSGERVNKVELIKYIIETESLDPSKTIMIGDRKHDILGAKRFGIRTIGVLYGYGSKEELIEAGTDELVKSAGEIAELIL